MVRHVPAFAMRSSVLALACIAVSAISVTVVAGNDVPSWPIPSLESEDAMGLRGMSYNETQPGVRDPNEFKGKRIGIIVSHCFEEVELTFPYIFFARRGAEVHILGPWWVTNSTIAACEFVRATNYYKRDHTFQEAAQIHYDALIVAGGVWSSTVVRNDNDAVALLQQQFQDKSRVLATVCSGSTALINAGLAKGRSLTGSPSIRIDLENAGATYLDVPAHIDLQTGGAAIVTGRSPGDLDSLHFAESIASALHSVSPTATARASLLR